MLHEHYLQATGSLVSAAGFNPKHFATAAVMSFTDGCDAFARAAKYC